MVKLSIFGKAEPYNRADPRSKSVRGDEETWNKHRVSCNHSSLTKLQSTSKQRQNFPDVINCCRTNQADPRAKSVPGDEETYNQNRVSRNHSIQTIASPLASIGKTLGIPENSAVPTRQIRGQKASKQMRRRATETTFPSTTRPKQQICTRLATVELLRYMTLPPSSYSGRPRKIVISTCQEHACG